MQHEQWATVQIEQPNFVARKGVWALACCYVTAFAAIITVGMLGPSPLYHKTYRDVDYDVDLPENEARGSSIAYDDETGDALWKVHIRGLEPEKQFVHVNARLQRPGWNDGAKSSRNVDFSFRQEFTLFSQLGTDSHYLAQHSDAMGNHTSHHHVKCLGRKRFCEPFTVFRKDLLVSSAVYLEVLFYRPDLWWNGGHKIKDHQIGRRLVSPEDGGEAVVLFEHSDEASTSTISSISSSSSHRRRTGRAAASGGAAAAPATAGADEEDEDEVEEEWEEARSSPPEAIAELQRHRALWGSEVAAGEPTLMPTLPVPSPAPTVDFFNFNQNATFTLLLEVVTVNKSYTRFEMALRYTFLLVTVCVFVKFLTQMNQLSSQMWGYQQKWILNLLGFLVLFDGPLYAAKVYTVDYDINLQDHDTPEDHGRTEASDAVTDQLDSNKLAGRILGYVSMFCTSSFVALLMVYFLSILEEMGSGGIWKFFGLDACTNRVFSNSLKCLLVGSFWVTTFVAYVLLAHAREADPSFTLFDGDENQAKVMPAVIGIGCLFALYGVWLLVLLCDAARALRGLSPPFRFIAAITLVTLTITLVGPWLGATFAVPKTAVMFTVFFGGLNLYVYVLAFAYMPKLDDMALSSNDALDALDGGGGGGMEMEMEMSGGGGSFGKLAADMHRELGDGDDEEI